MKKHLILPIAGQSTRYPQDIPKYFLKHPKGTYMLTEAIRGVNPSRFNSIVLIGLKEHEQKYQSITKCAEEIYNEYHLRKGQVLRAELCEPTKSQPETIYKGINLVKIPNPDGIFIKDCDGYFTLDDINWNQNFVTVADLNTIETINAGNKSYIELNENNTIGNIVEKQVISNLFSVGGYYFRRTEDFKKTYTYLSGHKSLYVSHIIYQMLTENKTFFSIKTPIYNDWGTINDWTQYKTQLSEQKSIVIDVDNTLCVTDSSIPYSQREPKQKVIKKLQEYQKKGYYIIIETGRQMRTHKKNIGVINAQTLPTLINWLNKHNVPYDEIHIGKPWQGKEGFRVDDKTIRPNEFITLSEKEIKELIS